MPLHQGQTTQYASMGIQNKARKGPPRGIRNPSPKCPASLRFANRRTHKEQISTVRTAAYSSMSTPKTAVKSLIHTNTTVTADDKRMAGSGASVRTDRICKTRGSSVCAVCVCARAWRECINLGVSALIYVACVR